MSDNDLILFWFAIAVLFVLFIHGKIRELER